MAAMLLLSIVEMVRWIPGMAEALSLTKLDSYSPLRIIDFALFSAVRSPSCHRDSATQLNSELLS